MDLDRRRRPPSLSAPCEISLGLGSALVGAGNGVSTPRLPLIPFLEGERSPLPSNSPSAALADGASSPAFYTAPLVAGASGEASPRPRPSFVGGGMLGRGAGFLLPHSLSLGRLEHAPPPPPAPAPLFALRVPDEAAAQKAPPAAAHEEDACCGGPSCCEAAHVWAMRFAVHVVLLSLFETLFFWKFVGPSEDRALLDLVNSYVGGTLSACPRWNATERLLVEAFMGLLLNRTALRRGAAAAAAKREQWNGALLRNSWLYVAGLAFFLLFLSAFGARRKGGILSLPWKVILLENLALIAILGLYELMFFSSVVLPYQVRRGAPGPRRRRRAPPPPLTFPPPHLNCPLPLAGRVCRGA